MTQCAAQLLIDRERRHSYGSAPRTIGGVTVPPDDLHLSGDEFLLHTHDGARFHYRKGDGVTIDRGPASELHDEALWLNGCVHAAIACINGFRPIHASAVAHEGRVYAFTGPSGAGKSTLTAALGRYDLPLFCDDTLVLDLSNPARITCLPGHKRLKLAPEALTLTGAMQQEAVGALTGKFYAEPPAGTLNAPLPLAALIFLDEGPDIALHPMKGAERFVRLGEPHYTEFLFAKAHGSDEAALFAARARLASEIPMFGFTRPRDATRFDESVALAFAHITQQPEAQP